MFAYGHLVVGIAIVEHPLGDGGGGMFAVGENTDLRSAFDEGLVELRPRTACKGYDAHVVVGYHESVGQHLEGVERGIDHNLCLGHLAADGVGKAEEEWVARGEDDDGK